MFDSPVFMRPSQLSTSTAIVPLAARWSLRCAVERGEGFKNFMNHAIRARVSQRGINPHEWNTIARQPAVNGWEGGLVG
jgi:hypothetical protein